jgi:hypothetical protein
MAEEFDLLYLQFCIKEIFPSLGCRLDHILLVQVATCSLLLSCRGLFSQMEISFKSKNELDCTHQVLGKLNQTLALCELPLYTK